MLLYALLCVQFPFWPLECHRKLEILFDNLDKENHRYTGFSVKLLFFIELKKSFKPHFFTVILCTDGEETSAEICSEIMTSSDAITFKFTHQFHDQNQKMLTKVKKYTENEVFNE